MLISRSVRDLIRIAITLGDAAGIGPEVTLKALKSLSHNPKHEYLLIGEVAFYEELAKKLSINIKLPNISFYYPEKFPSYLSYGKNQSDWTRIAVRSIEIAVKLALQKKVDAVVTAPIHKAGLKKAGFNIPGHTEYLAKLSKTKRFEMMLVGGPLRVALVTRHTAIKDVPSKISKKRIIETTSLTVAELQKSFGIKNPRIVICGLNPHAGEEGTIGKEEKEIIGPAVEILKQKLKAKIFGPFSPDALFYDAYTGKYDAEICMYHDQGLIPLKMISRGHGVNVTLGLPFVRTSPDHGTAYDIAGQGKADAGSMREAIELAVRLASNRRQHA